MLEFDIAKNYPAFSIDVRLSLGAELLVLFGPSGAGKTQVMRMISGLVRPDRGRVAIDGEEVFDSSRGIDVPIRDRGTGYLFQDYALFPHMTVEGNISYGMEGLARDEKARRVAELLEITRLTGLGPRYPRELSGGQRQRTALARTLATGPRILLLDEPFSALDYQVREKLRGDLLRIHDLWPITTILVTHDLEEAFMLGSRIAVINEGEIVQVGSREDVFYRPRTRDVARFMGVKNIFTGTVRGVEEGDVVIDSPDLGVIRAPIPPEGGPPAVGSRVSFCIRPEEILIIRPGKTLTGKARENVVEGEITSTIGKGATHILFIRSPSATRADDEEAHIKVEIPNFVLRKLSLATGGSIRVSLKKESVWIIPE